MINDIFVIAARKKYRFPFNGQISVEDLWDLTPAQLDKVYKTLKRDLIASRETDSLMTVRSAADADLENKVEIVRFVFDAKEEEKRLAVAKAELDAKKKRIREIIANKKEAELEGMSIEDLEKLLNDQ